MFIMQVNGADIAAIDNLSIVGLSSDPADKVVLSSAATFKISFSEVGNSPNQLDKVKGIIESIVTEVEGISLAKERPILIKQSLNVLAISCGSIVSRSPIKNVYGGSVENLFYYFPSFI